MTTLLNKTRQLEGLLRAQIRRGVWNRGSRLPAEDDLMASFGVSRPSMREALNTLASEGIVERRHGSGTYVKRIPVGRIAIYARLTNIASPAGYWHRDMVMRMSDHCKAADLRAEVIVIHGQEVEEVTESFERSLNFLPMAELEGAVCLTPSARFNEMLNELGVPHVALTYAIPGQGPSVILDYNAMSHLIRGHMVERGYPDYMVMHVDEPAGTIEPALRDYLNECLRVLTDGDRSRLLPVPRIESAREVFRSWWRAQRSRPSPRKPAIVFFDDALCDACCKAIWEEGIRIPEDLAILTHANLDKEFMLPVVPDRVTFSPQETADHIWALLGRVRTAGATDASHEIFIKPQLSAGHSL